MEARVIFSGTQYIRTMSKKQRKEKETESGTRGDWAQRKTNTPVSSWSIHLKVGFSHIYRRQQPQGRGALRGGASGLHRKRAGGDHHRLPGQVQLPFPAYNAIYRQ